MPRALPLAHALGAALVLVHTGVPLHWVWAGGVPALPLGVPAALARPARGDGRQPTPPAV